MLEDQKIESEIKESLENYQIKTSSQQILNAFTLKSENKEKEKKIGFNIKRFIPVLTFSCAALSLFVLITPLINKKGSPRPTDGSSLSVSQNVNIPFNPNYKQDQTAFSIFSAVNFMEHIEISSPLAKQKITQDEFKEVAQSFDNSFDVINSLFQEQNTYKNEFFTLETPFVGKFGTYNYLMNLTFKQCTYNFYTEMSFEEEHEEDKTEINTEFKGELIIDENNSYKTIMTIEEDLNEKGIETTIYLSDNSLINIEQEVMNNEKEYSYTFVQNKKIVYEENLRFDRGHRKKQKCSLQIKNNNKKIEYKEITSKDNNLNAKYSYRQYNGEFKLLVNGNNHTYIDQETALEINL